MDDGYSQLGHAWDRIDLLEALVARKDRVLRRIAALDTCPHAARLARAELGDAPDKAYGGSE